MTAKEKEEIQSIKNRVLLLEQGEKNLMMCPEELEEQIPFITQIAKKLGFRDRS